jgi:membrane protein YdbS with pleckstrin-like domain
MTKRKRVGDNYTPVLRHSSFVIRHSSFVSQAPQSPLAIHGSRAKSIAMPEQTIWTGTSSHWKNFNAYALTLISIALCFFLQPHTGPWIFALTALLAGWSLWKWLLLRTTRYTLSNERLVTTHGILTKVTDTLELYRVRDMQIIQPPLLRIVGLQNINVFTSDSSTSELFLTYIPTSLEIGDKLRKSVEECREAKRVRAMDVLGEQAQGMPPITEG